MKLDDKDLKILDEAQDLLMTDYEVIKYPSGGGWIEHNNLISMIEEFNWATQREKERRQREKEEREEEFRERQVLGI